jgi:hypothetical protein
MPKVLTNQPVNVEFIRLLFADPVEEEIAHRWAFRFAAVIGAQALQLRPATTLAEMLRWAAAANVDSMDFVVVFEPELRMEFAEFLDYCEHATFREMVEHYASRFDS